MEKTLAGCIIQKPEIVAEISGIVFPEDFSDYRAATVYRLASSAFQENRPFDLAIAASEMPGHAVWLAEAVDVIPINYRHYAEQINENARKRRILEGIKKISAQGLSVDDMLWEITSLHKRESKIAKKNGEIKKVVERTFAIIMENQRRNKMHGISTGFSFLDDIFVRYIPGHMWVITGFTSTGKTTLLIEMLARLRQAKTLVISTEMTEEQLVSRMIARDTGYHNQLILSGRVDDYEGLIDQVKQRISASDMVLNDDVLEIAELESIISQESMRRGVDVVFIDYVQQLRAKGIPRKEWGKEIAERIQQLAKRANTCIVCMSQVSNEIGRGVSDQFEAKGAGEWAACADVGIRLKRSNVDRHKLVFDMQKGRHFGTLCRDLWFQANFTRIQE